MSSGKLEETTTCTSSTSSSSRTPSGRLRQTLQTIHPVFKELLAGGTAGACAKSVVAPLERVKIIIQTTQLQHTTAPSPSLRTQAQVASVPTATTATANINLNNILRNILRTEGTFGLWKGNGASVLRVIPYAALHFSAYERFRTWLLGLDGTSMPEAFRVLGKTPAVDFIAGSMAGATAVAATYPLDLVRTRLAWRTSGIEAGAKSATQPQSQVQRSTMAGILGSLARREGIPGLYKGVGPTLLGIFPYAGLKFFVYQYLKGLYIKSNQNNQNNNSRNLDDGDDDEQQQQQQHSDVVVGTPVKLVFGACAGLVAQTITYPLDVVRRRMQVQDMVTYAGAEMASGSSGSETKSTQSRSRVMIRNSWHGLKMIYKTMGLRKGLYAGLSLNYLKVVPSTAIGFAVYDTAKEYLKHKTSI